MPRYNTQHTDDGEALREKLEAIEIEYEMGTGTMGVNSPEVIDYIMQLFSQAIQAERQRMLKQVRDEVIGNMADGSPFPINVEREKLRQEQRQKLDAIQARMEESL